MTILKNQYYISTYKPCYIYIFPPLAIKCGLNQILSENEKGGSKL